MRLYIEGPVNKYYVQTLCMIFFPGAKFSNEEEPSAETPALWVSLQRDAVRAEESGEPREGVTVRAKLCFRGEQAEAERSYPYREGYTRERMEKIAVGDAVTNVCETLRGYRPAWGMLTGVRPSKVATELLQRGMSMTRVKRNWRGTTLSFPKRQALLPRWRPTRRASSQHPASATARSTYPSPSARRDAPTAPLCPTHPSVCCRSFRTTFCGCAATCGEPLT